LSLISAFFLAPVAVGHDRFCGTVGSGVRCCFHVGLRAPNPKLKPPETLNGGGNGDRYEVERVGVAAATVRKGVLYVLFGVVAKPRFKVMRAVFQDVAESFRVFTI
jgi:hypothetical protein